MKKTKKYTLRLIAFISCIILTLCAAAPVLAISPSEARNGVVAVFRADGTAQGSGFAIGEVGKPVEYIVTNNHVVRGEWGNTTAIVYFSIAADEKMMANVYFYDAERDIAVLKLPQPTDQRTALALRPMKYVDLDDNFAALGYPGNQDTDWPKYSVDDISITRGGIKKSDRLDGQDVYVLDLAITHGNSGGPLINSDGDVIGINTKRSIAANGEPIDNYAIAIDELLDVINTDKIPVTVHTSDFWLYVIIGGSILLAILILAAVLIILNRDKYGKGGSNNVGPSVPAGKQYPKPMNKSARIIAIGGPLNGRRYDLNGTVKIGRDSSKCAIAFPVNTQGVSGVHCEVAFDGSVCYVNDLNSSYGTYTMDGKKLAPNSPAMLHSGDRFYLASPTNTFEIVF